MIIGRSKYYWTDRFSKNVHSETRTTYFRHTFSVADPSLYLALELGVIRDDGAVVYLNGTEVYRSNMPEGLIGFDTTTSSSVSGSSEDAIFTKLVDAANLQAGNNVLAVEVHQRSGTSSDIGLDVQLLETDRILIRGPYLQMGTESAVSIRWRTLVATNSRVEVGTSPGTLSTQFDDASLTTEHEIRVSGLSPNTTYYYAIGSQSERAVGGDGDHFFVTSPPPGSSRASRIWVLGDSGTANSNSTAVRDAYYSFTGVTHTDFVMMLGDNAYNDGTDEEYQAAVFDMYPTMLRKSVVWSTLGNHDGHTADSASETGPYYDLFTLPEAAQAGGLASGTEAYYSFDYGNIHFVCLNSYDVDRSPGGPMLTWLENDLLATNATWVVAFWHHPAYSKGSHDSDTDGRMTDMREDALPILEDYGVDLVLAGHSHAYERSMLIDGHYGLSTSFAPSHVVDGGDGDPSGDGAYQKALPVLSHDGAVYAVAGSSGKISGGALNHPVMVLSLNLLGSMVLDFDSTVIDATFLDSTGTIQDTFRIIKGIGTPTPTETSAVTETPTPTPTLPPSDVMIAYKAKASRLDDNNLPRNWVVLLDDVIIDDADADDPENYEARKSTGLLNPASDLDGPADEPQRHYISYALKEGREGVADLSPNGRFPRAVRHIRRRWQLDNSLGTVKVDTARVSALLVPAALSEIADPTAPDAGSHYICYRAKRSRGQDSEQAPGGKLRRDLQIFGADAFDDCALNKEGNVSFDGTAASGMCLFNLRRPSVLCNPVTKSAVEAPRETSASGITESVPAGSSLLCYVAQLANKVTSVEAAATLGLLVGDRLDSRQQKHEKRLLKEDTAVYTAAGNGFLRPSRMDTRKVASVCLPTTVTSVQ